MRTLHAAIVLLLGILLAVPASAQAARDWRAAIRQTPAGAYVIGNPKAPVKLVEYLSYTCPHCGKFVAESKGELFDDLVRRGRVSVEVRHAVRDGLDLTAALLVRCTGPANFLASHGAVFAGQESMLTRAQSFQPAAGTSQGAQLVALADASGVSALLRPRLNTAPAACLSASADRQKLVAMAEDAFRKIQGTPSFEIDGAPAQGNDWAAIKPQLLAAGAR